MLCYKRKFRKLSGYLLHLRIRHASESNFRVVCGIIGCGAQYDKYASLYKHICRHHRHLLPARTTSIGEEKCTEDDDDDEKVTGILCKVKAILEMCEKFGNNVLAI